MVLKQPKLPRKPKKMRTKSPEEIAKERYYLDLKPIKVLKTGGKSKYVHLMSDNCVKKRYDSTIKDHQDHFEREVALLRHLEQWPHSPRILWINWKKKSIYMTYCGPNPEPSEKLTGRLVNLMEQLRKNWEVYRFDTQDRVTDHIDIHNLCFKNDRLYIIDFGSPLWVLQPPGRISGQK